jgi:hypothetical protein
MASRWGFARRVPTLAIILLASLPSSPSAEAIQTLDLGRLTWLDAQQLHGRPVRVVFTVDSLADESDPKRGVIVEAEVAPGVSWCVRFASRVEPLERIRPGQRIVVDGVLRVSYHLARVIDGERFEAVRAVTVEEGHCSQTVANGFDRDGKGGRW